MGDEGGKNADSRIVSASFELDPLDDIPTPTMSDFDDGVGEEERRYYLEKFREIKNVRRARLHCTACDKHLGLLTRHINRYRMHPMLKTLVCISCQDFYNSGEFEKGEDGSELYCRWCGQGGQVYCCSSCPMVFCEKCIKRNFGVSKINEIESNDDWLCFSCNPKPLWTLRAKFWVLIIYCTFKNNQAQQCSDTIQRAVLLRRSQVDESECCKKNVVSRKSAPPVGDNKRKQSEPRKVVDNRAIVPINDQKKTISIDEARQAIKRLGSPVSIKKVTIPNAVPSMPLKMSIPSVPSPLQVGGKRMKMNTPQQQQPHQMTPRFPVAANMSRTVQDKKVMPQPLRKPMPQPLFNGFSLAQGLTPGMREAYASIIASDNLNLSLDSLTQGIDMTNAAQVEAAAAAQEAAEEAALAAQEAAEAEAAAIQAAAKDDDVQCLTPATKPVGKPSQAPLRSFPASLPTSAFNNIIQMTENDVTINEVTGGLKFKVDPSTLSSSKMYKLPDGRIFAVNHNPNMPGGYSATIVAVDEASLRSGIAPPRGRIPPKTPVRQQSKPQPTPPKPQTWNSNSTSKMTTRSKVAMKTASGVDPTTIVAGSVEWFKFNIVDAIDVMNYVLQKLHKLKNSSPDLRNKNVAEIKELHQNFDQMLKTSCKRFTEVKDNLNQGFKNWLKDKNCSELYSDDEDDIQILADESGDKRKGRKGKISNNEPIFIDENSNDSSKNVDKGDEGQSNSDDGESSKKEETKEDGNKEDIVEEKGEENKEEGKQEKDDEASQNDEGKDVSMDDVSNTQDESSTQQDEASSHQDESNAQQDESSTQQDESSTQQDESNAQQEESGTQQDESGTQDETSTQQDNTSSQPDDSNTQQDDSASERQEDESEKVVENGKCNEKMDEADESNCDKNGDTSPNEEEEEALLADKDVSMETDDINSSLSESDVRTTSVE